MVLLWNRGFDGDAMEAVDEKVHEIIKVWG